MKLQPERLSASSPQQNRHNAIKKLDFAIVTKHQNISNAMFGEEGSLFESRRIKNVLFATVFRQPPIAWTPRE
jgi:hypothetical protein